MNLYHISLALITASQFLPIIELISGKIINEYPLLLVGIQGAECTNTQLFYSQLF